MTLHCVSSQSSNSEQAKQFPVANLADLLPLAVAFLNAVRERLEYGLGAILTAWFQQLAQRYAGNGAVMLPLPGKRILLVVDRDLSGTSLANRQAAPPISLVVSRVRRWSWWTPMHSPMAHISRSCALPRFAPP